MTTATQFEGIYHGLSTDVGKMRFAPAGLGWMSTSNPENKLTIPAGDIKSSQWLRVARNYQLRLFLNAKKDEDDEGRRMTFDGFAREDHEKIIGLMKQHYDVGVETKEISVKGWNWGTTDFEGRDLTFLVSNKTLFEVPLTTVSNSNIAGKTEVSLEFATVTAQTPEEKKKAKFVDELLELRFYVPGTVVKEVNSDDSDKERDGDDDEESAAQQLHNLVKERASLSSQTSAGALLVSFEDILVTTPRGRYDIDMFATFMRLRGKTYDYKVMYDSIKRLFLLSKDELHVQFLISISPPIRQGQTRYGFLVMQFQKDLELAAEINMEEEDIQDKYGEKLKKSYDEAAFQVVSDIFRGLTGKKIIGQTKEDAHGIKCNLKANAGEMHLLEKNLIFVSKQPVLVEFSDVAQAVFSRVGTALGTSRTFDLTIATKSSGTDYTFTAINKEEHESMEAFLISKKLRVKNEMADDVMAGPGIEDDEDEEMQSVASSGEERPAPRVGDEDEDSSEDESFQASSSDAGSPTSDSDEDSDAKSAASGGSTRSPKAKTKKAPPKEKSKEKEKNDQEKSKPKPKAKPRPKSPMEVDGSDDEGAKKAKPKPKPKPKAKEASEEGSSKPKAKPKPKPKAKEAMDVDEDGAGPSQAKPKPKPKPKAKPADGDGPPAKKPRMSDD
ncbi:SSrecog-domain-containing protein [Sistotremastrum niveocremeum HHB9708]|uniref:FACT complex subunit POB3 n=1 Tax=Sistotremastrum niveocremeum HHB9708 TaxID=1314777 RepID=A0A164UYT8_9AGAM|nr:SSrecog-domain-containing protein [Sistotremastrum niveocremeum HHB9708]